jgi:hypothetical protein
MQMWKTKTKNSAVTFNPNYTLLVRKAQSNYIGTSYEIRRNLSFEIGLPTYITILLKDL